MAVISGDGVFSHVFIGAADVEISATFYDAVLGALGVKNLGPFGNGWILYGKDKPAFIIARPGNGEAPSSNGVTIGFAAATTAEVDAFHAAGLANGGSDEGAAGARSHLPGAYAAYLRDPAGNKICSYTFSDGN
ncbi:VOC family protein [Sphingobium bisphenolivorans]|uniref:VOC family protein n=1 Tax=Sphingobium bisphenolivorans TaxID=1335760 RepID=UPI0003B5F7A4|nr:VOC family protein [Sphingobium bisphenolivorans]